MRKLYLAVAVIAIASISMPASALSPGECSQLQQQIRAARSRAVTGGYEMDPGYQTARAAEEGARDQMVAMGCNKRVNANKPECVVIIARVNEATANRRAMESGIRQARQIAGSAEEAELTARYNAECKQQARRQPDPDLAPGVAGAILTMGLGFGQLQGPGPSGPGGPGPMRHQRR